MSQGLFNRTLLDKVKPLELNLEIFSFAGGENTIGADHELKSNEARVIKNWDATALGKMIRAKGFNQIATGGGSYSDQLDLLTQHYEGSNTEVYGVIAGDLVILSGTDLNQEDASAFTADALCHAVSIGSQLFITNQTDGLHKKTIGVGIAAITDTPDSDDCARAYGHKQRLIIEGSSAAPRKIQGSRGGTANIDTSNGFSKAGDAWSILLPDNTQGCVPDWPSGDEITVFTKFAAYSLYNFPNVAFRPIGPKSFGCSAPYSIAKGNEGVFFVSEFPSKGVILWDGVNFVNLTENHDFVDDIDLSKRCFGIYRDRKYHLFYNDVNTSDDFPNRWRVYDTRFGRWWEREINSDLSDTFGYPTLLTRSNNELYVGSAQSDILYELETSDNDDEGNDTQADYKTKDFTSRDFNIATGGLFGIDNVRMKLIGFYLTYKGQTGNLTIQWTSDKGRLSGSRVIDMTAEGDLLNVDFVLNSSMLVSTPPSRTIFKTFGNNAVGRSFNIQILNNGQGSRPEVEKIKLLAIALEE